MRRDAWHKTAVGKASVDEVILSVDTEGELADLRQVDLCRKLRAPEPRVALRENHLPQFRAAAEAAGFEVVVAAQPRLLAEDEVVVARMEDGRVEAPAAFRFAQACL